MDTYRARHPRRAGTERRHVGINLSPDHWAVLEMHALKREEAMSYVCTRIVRAWVVERLALDNQRPAVYYDAQGREHEEGDVRV